MLACCFPWDPLLRFNHGDKKPGRGLRDEHCHVKLEDWSDKNGNFDSRLAQLFRLNQQSMWGCCIWIWIENGIWYPKPFQLLTFGCMQSADAGSSDGKNRPQKDLSFEHAHFYECWTHELVSYFTRSILALMPYFLGWVFDTSSEIVNLPWISSPFLFWQLVHRSSPSSRCHPEPFESFGPSSATQSLESVQQWFGL